MSRKNNGAWRVYDELYGLNPQDVAGQFNLRTEYYKTRLFRRILSIFNLKNVPNGWDEEWLKKVLFRTGYICIGNTPSYGVVPLRCSFYGLNLYDRPVYCRIDNHLIHDLTLTIGEDCTLLHLQNDYQGIATLLNIYAQKLASIDAGIDVNVINTKSAWIFDCDGKAQEETAKRFYDDVTAGRPVVFTRSPGGSLGGDGKINLTQLNVKNTYISDSLQELKKNVWYEFLTDIGINNANVEKRERVNTLEVEANNDELRNSVDDWRANIVKGFTDVNRLFGFNIVVDFPYYKENSVDRTEV